jgi:hypothetical protein
VYTRGKGFLWVTMCGLVVEFSESIKRAENDFSTVIHPAATEQMRFLALIKRPLRNTPNFYSP